MKRTVEVWQTDPNEICITFTEEDIIMNVSKRRQPKTFEKLVRMLYGDRTNV